jgi:hypothetical protein
MLFTPFDALFKFTLTVLMNFSHIDTFLLLKIGLNSMSKFISRLERASRIIC